MAPRRRALEPWTAEQLRLAELRVAKDDIDWAIHGQFVCGLDRVAGVDVSFFPDSTYAVAAVVVISFSSFKVLYARCAAIRLAVPYIPGYLAFREVPALATLLGEIPEDVAPQVVLVDGNGAFHPRRCGAATHLGIVTDFPTIGVAKTVQRVDDVNQRLADKIAKTLNGASAWAPLGEKGCSTEAEDGEEPLAMLLRPGNGKGTVVVSAGHRVSLATAVRLVATLCRAGRVPEPIRQADLQSRAAVREWFAGKKLGDLAVRGGLLPAIPNLKRKAEEEGEDGEAAPQACSSKGRCKDRGTSEAGAEPAPEPTARSSHKAAGKPGPVWRVKTSRQAPAEPLAALPAEPSGQEAPAAPGPAQHHALGKRAKVWRVKAAVATPAKEVEGANMAESVAETEASQEDCSPGFLERCFVWLGGLCLCRC